jgi:hypothetical protein
MTGVHYLVGTNVLLRLVKSDDQEFSLARSATHALKTRGDLLFFIPQNIVELTSARAQRTETGTVCHRP